MQYDGGQDERAAIQKAAHCPTLVDVGPGFSIEDKRGGILAIAGLVCASVLFGAPDWFLLVPMVICLSRALQLILGNAQYPVCETLSHQTADEVALPLGIVDLAFLGNAEGMDEIAETIKAATELGVLGAAENAAQISSQVVKREREVCSLHELLSSSSESLASVVALQTAFFESMASKLRSEMDASYQSQCSQLAEAVGGAEQAISDACALVGDLQQDTTELRSSSNQILVELQFQDKIRQELERIQHQTRVPAQVLRELAGEIANGTTLPEQYRIRTEELCFTVLEATKSDVAHSSFAGLDNEDTGEFEMF